jgi:hypothetical protein
MPEVWQTISNIMNRERALGMEAEKFCIELQKRIEEVVKQLSDEYPDIRASLSIKVDFVSK